MNTIFTSDVLEFIKMTTPPPAKFVSPLGLGKQIEVLPDHPSIQSVRLIEVTPALALLLLGSNEAYLRATGKPPNRFVNQKRTTMEMAVLAHTMETDQFHPSSSLGITVKGRTVEGQGRLMSIVRTGKTYKFNVDVLHDTEDGVAHYIANNRLSTSPATPAQTGELMWELSPKESALASQIEQGVKWHDKGILGSTLREYDWSDLVDNTKLPTDTRDIVVAYSKLKTPKGLNKAALATIELLALRKGYPPAKITAFRNGLLTGDEMRARDPRKMLRDFLIQRSKGTVLRYQAQTGYMKAAFDKFISNQDVTKVSSKVVQF